MDCRLREAAAKKQDRGERVKICERQKTARRVKIEKLDISIHQAVKIVQTRGSGSCQTEGSEPEERSPPIP